MNPHHNNSGGGSDPQGKAGRVQPQEAHGIDPVRGTPGSKNALATHATARFYTSLKKVWVVLHNICPRLVAERGGAWSSVVEFRWKLEEVGGGNLRLTVSYEQDPCRLRITMHTHASSI
jgi:hypothetical protein